MYTPQYNPQTPTKSQKSPISPQSTSSNFSESSPLAESNKRYGFYSSPTIENENTDYAGAGRLTPTPHGFGIKRKEVPKIKTVDNRQRYDSSTLYPQNHYRPWSPLNGASTTKYQALDGVVNDFAEELDRQWSPQTTLYSPVTNLGDRTPRFESKPKTSISSLKSWKDEHFPCRSRRKLRRGTIAKAIILSASVWSTAISGLWLGLALARPHYKQSIRPGGFISPTTATTLFAALAKSVELTFVTVVVTFIGQKLSQKACEGNTKGITIAEMQLRNWVMQPGIMVTHYNTLRFGLKGILGVSTLVAAIVAMLYTTASDALVSPRLHFTRPQDRTLSGRVIVPFGNVTYQQDQCSSPIPSSDDPQHGSETCYAIEIAGQSYQNFFQYLKSWKSLTSTSQDQKSRLAPFGIINDNITAYGSWISTGEDMKDASAKFDGRIINNVILAMPHTGVISAARDPENRILQPQNLDNDANSQGQQGLGDYYLRASVVSPAINVMCANVTHGELYPILVSEWPQYKGTPFNGTKFLTGGYASPPDWYNETTLEDVFYFGRDYNRAPPWFGKLPEAYNTIVNFTIGSESDSLYVLATSGDSTYSMCSLRTSLSPVCSTEYHATMTGGNLTAQCEGADDYMSFHRFMPSSTEGSYRSLWKDVAVKWGLAVSLNGGLFDAQASIARLLTQLIPRQPALDPKRPSMAEGLAAMASSTLLLSSIDAPFTQGWDFGPPPLHPPARQTFRASLRSQDYTSGITQRWQGVFYPVLAFVFFFNVFCLTYFIRKTDLITDFMEPQNLFALSLNSSPSHVLDGACGGGPESEHLKTSWKIGVTEEEHFYIGPAAAHASAGKDRVRVREGREQGAEMRQKVDLTGIWKELPETPKEERRVSFL